MADKISKKSIAENSTDVSLKTSSDFQSSSNPQELQSSNEFDGNTISACFSNILEKFTMKQANIMGSFAEVLTNNQTKNIQKISDEIGKKLETFNDSLTAYNKTKSRETGDSQVTFRETGDSHPPAEDELPLYGGSDLDQQNDPLVDTTNSQVNFVNHNKDEFESEESDEDDLMKDSANDFSAAEKTGPHVNFNFNQCSMFTDCCF